MDVIKFDGDYEILRKISALESREKALDACLQKNSVLIDRMASCIADQDKEIADLKKSNNELRAELEKENAKLREYIKKAGEEIKHLRACIVDQADNNVEISMLKTEVEELRERLRLAGEVISCGECNISCGTICNQCAQAIKKAVGE